MHKQTHLRVEIVPSAPKIIYTPEMFGFRNIEGTGKGTRICIIDAGLPNNKYIQNIYTCANFTSDKESKDYQGKSTVVAGLLTGKSNEYVGMCPNSVVYIAKSIDNSGMAQYDAAIASVLWAIIQEVDIIVIPTELEDSCDILTNAFNKALENNISIVMAGSEAYPVLSVRDLDVNKDKTSHFLSNNVVCVNGDKIYSTFMNDQFALCQGVSCSVALVAGIMSRLIEQNRSLGIKYNPKLLLNQLMESLTKGQSE